MERCAFDPLPVIMKVFNQQTGLAAWIFIRIKLIRKEKGQYLE